MGIPLRNAAIWQTINAMPKIMPAVAQRGPTVLENERVAVKANPPSGTRNKPYQMIIIRPNTGFQTSIIISVKTGATVWSNTVSEAGPISQRSVPGVVSQMNRTLAIAIDKLLASVPAPPVGD